MQIAGDSPLSIGIPVIGFAPSVKEFIVEASIFVFNDGSCESSLQESGQSSSISCVILVNQGCCPDLTLFVKSQSFADSLEDKHD